MPNISPPGYLVSVVSGNNAPIYASLVTNNGIISTVGSNTQSFFTINPYPGMMMGGNYTQTSEGLLRLKVLAPGFCDQLQIAGTATLAGGLDIVLATGYQPAGQNPLTWTPILYNGQNNGQFTSGNRPPNFGMPNYFGGGMTITWTPP